MKFLQLELQNAGFENVAYWRLAYDRHGAPLLDELAAVVDHVTAYAAGGVGVAENLVTACNKCNMRKNNSNAVEWEKAHPVRPVKAKFGEPVAWDGLSTVFVLLAARYPQAVTKTEREWLKVLTSVASPR